MKRLAKTYDPKIFEEPIYQAWERAGAFKPQGAGGGEPYTIMMPPPNVTGRLHMGHALNMTLQDIMARYQRMKGRDVLWQAGTDHAGIATQAVVERELARTSNKTRQEIGRGAFEKKVWEWKENSGDAIVHQLKRLGASCDWESGRFTLDEGMSNAVRTAFVKLYEDGLIYRAQRLVNWDVKLKTAISDLEVIQKEVQGHLWHLRYPLADASGFIVVATTRPETMLGDCAVAVHPEDERYRALIGQQVLLPLTQRLIPIVADSYADPKQGSGAVKITPAHDFNDFEVGVRHNLTPLNILDEGGAVLGIESIPAAYRGLSREVARKKIVADLEDLDLLEKIEEIRHAVPYGDRSDEVIEPFLTWQWFVDAKTLAAPALAAVREGKTTFVPDYWQKTYFEWLENIQPWCISRQLWWGHRIPAWYDEEGNHYVAMTEAEALTQAGGKPLRQEEDVLDTWFSSGLWPFSTLGWENGRGRGGSRGGSGEGDDSLLARHFPTDLLITGLDIIFFWVARMMMFSLYFTKEVPFKDVYIHALVRDEKGQKMTKSKGNVVDPLVLMDKYGADALRFTMAAMAVQGQDLKLSEARIEGYRNFATKVWNAARFCEMNECVYDKNFDPRKAEEKINQWALYHLADVVRSVEEHLDSYKFNLAAAATYQFVWHAFCDWYVELAKVDLKSGDEKKVMETKKTLAFVLQKILILLHPFMPFITEELWKTHGVAHGAAARDGEGFLMNSSYGGCNFFDYEQAAGRVTGLQLAIEETRRWREILNVPPATAIKGFVEENNFLLFFGDYLSKLASLELIGGGSPPASAIKTGKDFYTLYLDFGDSIDRDAQRQRLEKEIIATKKEIEKLESKLSQQDFLAKARAAVITLNRERLEKHKTRRDRLATALEALR